MHPEDSDIDPLVLLGRPVRSGRDLQLSVDALYTLPLEIRRCTSPKSVDERQGISA